MTGEQLEVLVTELRKIRMETQKLFESLNQKLKAVEEKPKRTYTKSQT